MFSKLKPSSLSLSTIPWVNPVKVSTNCCQMAVMFVRNSSLDVHSVAKAPINRPTAATTSVTGDISALSAVTMPCITVVTGPAAAATPANTSANCWICGSSCKSHPTSVEMAGITFSIIHPNPAEMASDIASKSIPLVASRMAFKIPVIPVCTAVKIGWMRSDISAIVSWKSAAAWLDSTKDSLFSCHACPACTSPCFASSCMTMFCRSVSSDAAARRSLNSSSLVPAQLSTSANEPVTCPAWMVSFTDSARLSIGMESP